MKNYIAMALCSVFILSSCRQNNGDYKKFTQNPLLFSKTVKKLNEVVLENNFPPMIGSRNYVYASIAAYETMAAGNKEYKSLSGQIKHLPPMPSPPAGIEIDYSLAALFSFTKVGNAVTFPEGSMMEYYEELKTNAEKAGIPSSILNNTIAFSDTIVASILKWSAGDNYAATRSAERFALNNDEGRWIPTPPMYAQAMEPHWMNIRPMVIDSPNQCRPLPPPVYNIKNKQSIFYTSLMEVKNIVDSLTEDQKHIAGFWDDNPFKLNVSGHVMFATKKFSPGGHWMNIVGIAAKEKKADFNTTVAAYANTAIAMFDSFISCWDSKFHYNLIRPETVINKYMDENWQPYLQTPPFPSYTSGHATVSAAAAEVMTHWFGDSVAFTDTSSLEFGIQSRHFSSLRQAAQEAALSRLYGGIHYRFDNNEGANAGKKIGQLVVEKLQFKKPD